MKFTINEIINSDSDNKMHIFKSFNNYYYYYKSFNKEVTISCPKCSNPVRINSDKICYGEEKNIYLSTL